MRELYYKRIGDSVVMYRTGIHEPILIPKMGSPEILTGIDAYKKLFEQRQLIKAKYVVTGLCNQRCYHCYASGDYDKVGVSTEAAKKIIDEIANAGVLFLQLDGGEVGCRKDLSDLINHATDRGLLMEFFTNGSLFNKEFFINTNFDNIYAVYITIHSHVGTIHDKLTNLRGSFEKAIRNIKRFSGKVRNTSLKMTVTKKNLGSLGGLYNLSKQLGVTLAYDIGLLPQSISPQDSLELDEDDIRWMREKWPDIFVNVPTKRICVGGRSSCAIDQDGNLFPCRFVNIKLGNVLQEPLVELWNSDIARNVADKIYSQPAECMCCDELSIFCFYCPGIPFMKGIQRERWVEYTCSLARKKRVLYRDD